MDRFKKIFILIIMVTGLLLLTGCSILQFDFFDASKEEENSSVITLAPSEKEESSSKISVEKAEPSISPAVQMQGAEATPTPSVIQPTNNIDLPLYTVNVDTGEIEAVVALVPADTKITPELVVEKVVESMADRSIKVGIESVTTKGDTVIVSFYKDMAPLSEIGSGYEAAILDAIAQSLVDALEDYNKVIFRAEGKAYVGSHIELGLNEVYLEDN